LHLEPVPQAEAEALVEAAYTGLLRRPSDAAREHYIALLTGGLLSRAQLLSYFASLDEFYLRAQPENRDKAIAALYSDGDMRVGDASTWSNMPRDIIFFHFPKTAGMSLQAAICGHLHPLQIGLGGTKQHKRYHAFHMSWEEYCRLPRPAITVTALRDPAARLISLFRFLRAIGATVKPRYQAAAAAAIAGQLDFLASSDSAVINDVNNCYVRTLSGYLAGPDGDPLKRDPRGALDLATERALRFDGVYTVEEVASAGGRLPERIVSLLSETLNVSFPQVLPKVNVTGASVSDEPLDDRLMEANVELDREFYARMVAASKPVGPRGHQAVARVLDTVPAL
jgi:hypothetical protein